MFWQSKQETFPKSAKTIGFWAIGPINVLTPYLKLAIKDSYTTGAELRYVVKGACLQPAWAIIAGFQVLCDHFRWLREFFRELANVVPANVFKEGADPAAQAQALNVVEQQAVEHGWSYVLQLPNAEHKLVMPESIPTFARQLFLELTGKVVREPENVRLPYPISPTELSELQMRWNIRSDAVEDKMP